MPHGDRYNCGDDCSLCAQCTLRNDMCATSTAVRGLGLQQPLDVASDEGSARSYGLSDCTLSPMLHHHGAIVLATINQLLLKTLYELTANKSPIKLLPNRIQALALRTTIRQWQRERPNVLDRSCIDT